jgi:signal transduction histidine kinase
VHPDEYPETLLRWTNAMQTGQAYEMEYRLKRAVDGMYRWHLGRAIPLRDLNGRIVKWLGVCTDIHDQKMATKRMEALNEELEERVQERTKQLEESNASLQKEIAERERMEQKERAGLELLRTVLERMPLGAVIWDEHRTVIHANEIFCRLFDIDAMDVVGKAGVHVVEKAKRVLQDPVYSANRLKQILEDGVPSLQQELAFRSGTIVVRDYLPVLVAGVLRGHLFLYRDVTQERMIDRAKSEFMSLASHQLRTPLTAIRWALSRLKKKENDPTLFSMINTASEASSRMAETISTMLTISAAEAKTMQPKVAPVEIRTLLETVQKECFMNAERKKQHILIEADPALVIQSDANILKEILCNLLTNAVKYSPDKTTITLHAREHGNLFSIDVVDSGYGIPEHQQEKVFSKFFRGDNVRVLETEGTGLGLYLVSLLVKVLGGSISFISTEKGTTFTLSLEKSRSLA